MQWCKRPHAKTRFYFSFYNRGASLSFCSLFTKWQAESKASLPMHLSSITVQTHCLQVLGRRVCYTLWKFLLVPLEWCSQASYFHCIKPPKHSWVLMQFRECACHLFGALSVSLRGLYWYYVRLSMHNSCRGKTQLNKSHTGLRLSALN